MHRGASQPIRLLAHLGLSLTCASTCACASARSPGPPDVLIVALDTIRWDHTDLAAPPSGITPNLSAFANLPGSVTFSQAYTDAAWSQPAYVSLLTGQRALTHGVGFLRSALIDGQATVATMFQAHGYETRAFASGPHLAPISGIASDFDAYIHSIDQRTIGIQVGPALEWLQQPRTADQPRFGFIHGYDAHAPYGAPAALSDPLQPGGVPLQNNCMVPGFRCHPPGVMANTGPALAPEEQAQLVGAYQASVLYADHHLGRILHTLETTGALEHTIVIVLSDHGEMLGESGGLGHDDGYADHVFHVPLVVRFPSDAAPRTVDRVVSLSDITPTLARRLDMVPPSRADGVVIGELLSPAEPSQTQPHRGASLCCYYVRDNNDAGWVQHGTEPLTWNLLSSTSDARTTERRLQTALGDWPSVLEKVDEVNHEMGHRDPALKRALQDAGYWRQATP